MPRGFTLPQRGDDCWVQFDRRGNPQVMLWQGTSDFTPDPSSTVTSLPASPVDGQEVSYLVDATNGVVWQLKYRAATSGTAKWHSIGGASLYSENLVLDTTTSASFIDIAGGPTLTIPVAGTYEVEYGARAWSSSSAQGAHTGIFLGATPTEYLDSFAATAPTAYNAFRATRATLAASATVKLQYRGTAAANTYNFEKRWVRVRPVKIGP
jgi:hypothetical protein